MLCTRVYYIVGHFAPSAFVLCTRILIPFASSGFALCARILSLFAHSSLVLCAHILLTLLTHVSHFPLTKIFEKKCISIESKYSEHRNANNASPVALLGLFATSHSQSLCSLGLHPSHLHSQSLCSFELSACIFLASLHSHSISLGSL